MDDFGWVDTFQVVVAFSGPLVALFLGFWAMMRFSLKSMASEFASSLKAIESEFASSLKAMESRIDGSLKAMESRIDGSLKAMESRIDGSLKAMESRIDGSLKAIESKIDGIDKRLDSVEANVAYLGQQVAGVKERVAYIEGRLGIPTPDPEQA